MTEDPPVPEDRYRDPVVDAYKKKIDMARLRQNLRLTPEERLIQLAERLKHELPPPAVDVDCLSVDEKLALFERLSENLRRGHVEALKSLLGSIEVTIDLDKSRRRLGRLEPEG